MILKCGSLFTFFSLPYSYYSNTAAISYSSSSEEKSNSNFFPHNFFLNYLGNGSFLYECVHKLFYEYVEVNVGLCESLLDEFFFFLPWLTVNLELLNA